MLFRYQAVDASNTPREGTIDAVTMDVAINSLQHRGYVVSSIDPLSEPNSIFNIKITAFERVSNKEVVIFSRQIATLFEAQVSALRVFRLLAAESDNSLLGRILTEVADDLQGGSSISNALAKHPDLFSPFYVSMVKAGEEAGKLDKTFDYLADYLDRTYEVVNKARNALIYPAFVITTFVAVMVLMLTLVIPRITDIIVSSGQEVPVYTRIVMWISSFFSNYIAFILFFIAVLAVGAWRFKRTAVGTRAFDELKLAVPYVGVLYEKLYLSRIADNLATMLASGISMVQALEITSEVVDNEVYKEILIGTIAEVKAGKSVSDALSEYPEIPGVMTQMAKVGEETGNLGSILETLAKFYRREVHTAVDTLINLIEPAMIVLLGLGVGTLLAAVLLPIYNIAGAI
ncbi:type II secretion system F family protein [Candidatus Kaiserbacteria bacterium]|nr:type II secretion system F family protein [Candidatus Kaiserbacteria bacterium]